MNGEDDPLLLGPVDEAKAEPPLALRSDAIDCVLGPMGTVRLFTFFVESNGDADDDTGRGMSSSGGVWSAGGIGSPRAAAIIWCSVHCCSKSLSPLQKGANFLST